MTAKRTDSGNPGTGRKAEPQKDTVYENLMMKLHRQDSPCGFPQIGKKKENIWNSILMQRLPRSFLQLLSEKDSVSIFEK